MPIRVKIVTVVYFLILVGIVVLANNKGTAHLLRFSGGIPYFDKIAHFLLMGGFSFLLNLALKARLVNAWKVRYLLGTLLVLIIVTLEEFSQLYVSGRAFDIGDLVADYAGIFIFGEVARRIVQKYRVK